MTTSTFVRPTRQIVRKKIDDRILLKSWLTASRVNTADLFVAVGVWPIRYKPDGTVLFDTKAMTPTLLYPFSFEGHSMIAVKTQSGELDVYYVPNEKHAI